MQQINFSKPTLGREEEQAVIRVLRSGWLAPGPETERFEKEFARYVGVKYAIFTNSGTSALKMAYKWARKEMDIGAKSVVVPNNTFCATYSAAAETELNVYGYEQWEKFRYSKILRKSPTDYLPVIKVNVHYGGVLDKTPCLIEDSAHRIEPNDKLIGKIRIYSFYVTKNMTTGQGGMFVTNERSIYEKARLYWKDGLSTSTYERRNKWNYEIKAMAGGYDGNDLAAALGQVQLHKLPDFTKTRNRICERYNFAFSQKWQGNHLYPFFVKKEKEVGQLINHMSKNGIQCSYHYPNTGWLGVSLPIYPLLTDKEQEYIIRKVKEWKS